MIIDPRLLEEEKIVMPFEFNSYEEELGFKEQAIEWKKEYGKVYSIKVNDIVFFFRLLSKPEMDLAREMYEDDYERTEHICKLCVIEPVIEDYSIDIYAGIPEVLCKAILEESGYIDPEKVSIMIKRWEERLNDVEYQLPLVIKEAFPDIPLEEIESWSMDKMSEYYVKAKWLLENLRGLQLSSKDEI